MWFYKSFPITDSYQKAGAQNTLLILTDWYNLYHCWLSGTFHDVCITSVTLVMTDFLNELFNLHTLNYSSILLETVDASSTLQ